MHTDPIADLLTRIRNAGRAHLGTVNVPYSKIKEGILGILKSKERIQDFEVTTEGQFKSLKVTLREDKEKLELKRVSKPGQRIYLKKDQIKPIKSGIGFSIISTSRGLMCNNDARKQNLGGELICEIC